MGTLHIKKYSTSPLFYEEFLKIYKNWIATREEKNSDNLILALMYLHLTLETLILYCVRSSVEDLNISNFRLKSIWFKFFEKESLNKKLVFFYKIFFLFFIDDKSKLLKSKLSKFVEKSINIRNLIVHGGELVHFESTDGLKGGSELYNFLEKCDLSSHYSDFRETLKVFFELLKKLESVDVRAGFNWIESIDFIEDSLRELELKYKLA